MPSVVVSGCVWLSGPRNAGLPRLRKRRAGTPSVPEGVMAVAYANVPETRTSSYSASTFSSGVPDWMLWHGPQM